MMRDQVKRRVALKSSKVEKMAAGMAVYSEILKI